MVQNQNVVTAFDEGEYQRIANLYVQVLEALKDQESQDERLAYSEPLAIKLFFHAATAYHLASGTNIQPLLAEPGIFFDFASVQVLARAALESYLAFHHVFVDPKSDDEFNFRYAAWELSGLAQRLRFPARLPAHQAVQRQAKERVQQLRETVRQTNAFSRLKKGEKENVLEGKKWRFAGWNVIAEAAGIRKDFFEFLYGYLSSYAHSERLSALQISQARSKDDQRDLLRTALDTIMLVLAKMIFVYTDKFPIAKKALERDPESAMLARVYAEVLGRLGFDDLDLENINSQQPN